MGQSQSEPEVPEAGPSKGRKLLREAELEGDNYAALSVDQLQVRPTQHDLEILS